MPVTSGRLRYDGGAVIPIERLQYHVTEPVSAKFGVPVLGQWDGEFLASDARCRDIFQSGATCSLELDNGRSGAAYLTAWRKKPDGHMVVEFRGVGPLSGTQKD